MTPAEELRAAATKLRDMAAKVPTGPWGTERYFWKTRSAAMPDQWMVAVTDENDDHVTAVSERHDCNDPGGEHHLLATDTTAWIALMGPDKAPGFAVVLEHYAMCIGWANSWDDGITNGDAIKQLVRSILGGQS